VSRDFDESTGLLRGGAQHTPVVILKPIDRASPGLRRALVQGERIPTVELSYFGRVEGETVERFTLTLTGAHVVSVDQVMRAGTIEGDPSAAAVGEYEQVSLTYAFATWTWVDGAVEVTQDWAGPSDTTSTMAPPPAPCGADEISGGAAS